MKIVLFTDDSVIKPVVYNSVGNERSQKVMQPYRQLPQSVFNTQSQALFDFLNSEGATTHIHQHQIDAVRAVHEHLSDPTKPNIALVVLPTGCGKTGVAVLASYVLNATDVLVITPSVTISKQIYDAFCDKDNMFLLKRQIITADQKKLLLPRGVCIKYSTEVLDNLHYPLMIVNAHKIGGRSNVAIEDIPSDNYDLVIVDEAHHYPAPTWKLLVDHFPNSRRLFLTATPSYRGKYILPSNPPCFDLAKDDAISRNIIRPIFFCEAEGTNRDEVCMNFYLRVNFKIRSSHANSVKLKKHYCTSGVTIKKKVFLSPNMLVRVTVNSCFDCVCVCVLLRYYRVCVMSYTK